MALNKESIEHSEKVARDLLNGLNSGWFNKGAFIRDVTHRGHRYLQSELASLVFEYIRYMSTPEYEKECTDGRNDWTIPIARELNEVLERH